MMSKFVTTVEAKLWLGADPLRINEMVDFDDWLLFRLHRIKDKIKYRGDNIVITDLYGDESICPPGNYLVITQGGKAIPMASTRFNELFEEVNEAV